MLAPWKRFTEKTSSQLSTPDADSIRTFTIECSGLESSPTIHDPTDQRA
jgi:hypothetical protein